MRLLYSKALRVYQAVETIKYTVFVVKMGHIFTRADLNLHKKRLSLKLRQPYLIDAPCEGKKMIDFSLVPSKYCKYRTLK